MRLSALLSTRRKKEPQLHDARGRKGASGGAASLLVLVKADRGVRFDLRQNFRTAIVIFVAARKSKEICKYTVVENFAFSTHSSFDIAAVAV